MLTLTGQFWVGRFYSRRDKSFVNKIQKRPTDTDIKWYSYGVMKVLYFVRIIFLFLSIDRWDFQSVSKKFDMTYILLKHLVSQGRELI
jgi:hypothetical protein